MTKLNEKDITRKNVDKYVLTHQDLDSDGGLATRLVKVSQSVGILALLLSITFVLKTE